MILNRAEPFDDLAALGHGQHSTMTPTAWSKSARGTPTLTVNRIRDRLSGVDGGRKQPTATPRSRHAAAQRTASSAEPAVTDSTPAAGVVTSKPLARNA